MELELRRRWYTVDSTIGELRTDGVWECFTLEDRVRFDGVKIPGQTAIPAGRYQVIVTPSGRAKSGTLWTPLPNHLLPELVEVPGFTAIRIHAGNRAKDVEGCIVVGQDRGPDYVSASQAAGKVLIPAIFEATRGGGCWITITDEPEAT